MYVSPEVRKFMQEIGKKGGEAAAKNPNYSKIRSDAAKLRWKRYRAALDKEKKQTPSE